MQQKLLASQLILECEVVCPAHSDHYDERKSFQVFLQQFLIFLAAGIPGKYWVNKKGLSFFSGS